MVEANETCHTTYILHFLHRDAVVSLRRGLEVGAAVGELLTRRTVRHISLGFSNLFLQTLHAESTASARPATAAHPAHNKGRSGRDQRGFTSQDRVLDLKTPKTELMIGNVWEKWPQQF